jgi:hypothetical protein
VTIAELERKNQRIFDLLFRHQVYLEGVKLGFMGNYRRGLIELYGEFAKYIGQTEYTQMDDFTRVQLADFVRRFQVAQTKFYSTYTEQMIVLFQDFLKADVQINKAIMEDATGMTTTDRYAAKQADDLPSLFGPAAVDGTNAGTASLWALIANTPIPANGMTIPAMLAGFQASAVNATTNRLRMGYANAETTRDTYTAIVGSKSLNYSDGLFGKFIRQNYALISTALQHISGLNQSAIASIHFNNYEWSAILDSSTTVICRSRDGNIYVYGQGPLPPAHWGCRSKTIPIFGDEPVDGRPATYYDWVITQPSELLLDMIGQAKMNELQNGAKAFSSINATRPLTITQFTAKLPFILYQEEDTDDEA